MGTSQLDGPDASCAALCDILQHDDHRSLAHHNFKRDVPDVVNIHSPDHLRKVAYLYRIIRQRYLQGPQKTAGVEKVVLFFNPHPCNLRSLESFCVRAHVFVCGNACVTGSRNVLPFFSLFRILNFISLGRSAMNVDEEDASKRGSRWKSGVLRAPRCPRRRLVWGGKGLGPPGEGVAGRAIAVSCRIEVCECCMATVPTPGRDNER